MEWDRQMSCTYYSSFFRMKSYGYCLILTIKISLRFTLYLCFVVRVFLSVSIGFVQANGLLLWQTTRKHIWTPSVMRGHHWHLIFKHSHFWLRLTCTTNLFGFILCIDRFALFQATKNWCAPVKSRQLFTQNQSYCHTLRKKKNIINRLNAMSLSDREYKNRIERRHRERERKEKTSLSTHYVLYCSDTQFEMINTTLMVVAM